MDVVAETREVGASNVSVEEEASGGLNAREISVPATAPTASSVQAAFFLSSKPSAVTSPSLVQLDSHSLTPHIPAPPAAAEARAAEMTTSVEPSTTASTTIFHSPSVVSPPPSSSPSDTAALVLPASSSSSLLDLSAAPGVAFKPSSIPSSLVGSPTYSPAVPSISRETPTAYSSSDMFQASTGIQSGDAHSESLGCSPPGDIPQPEMPSGGVGMNTSGQLLALPTALAPVEVPRPRPLEISPSEGADTASQTPSFSSADLSKHQRSLTFTSAPTDQTTTLQTPISSGSESQPDSPSFSIEELSAIPAPAESNVEMPTSSVALPLPGVRETDPVALSGLPVGASTGLLTDQLETSTSFPSGTSTIAIPSPFLISELSKTSPTLSITRFPNPLSVSSSILSPIPPIIGSSSLTHPAFAYSNSTSFLALLSSVHSSPSSSPSAGTLITRSSSSSFGQLSTRCVIPDASGAVSSSPLLEPISDINSSGNVNASTTVAPSIVSFSSSPPRVPRSLNSPTVCDTASFRSPAGSGDGIDCRPSLSMHFTNSSNNSASIAIQADRSSLVLKSIKEELKSSSGPPIVPSFDTLPRRPARARQKGEGWPYAPQGWPETDDKWLWRVGKRVHVNGYFTDRYLGLPQGLCKGRKATEFASKRLIVEYLKENFPDISVENFFKSFQWRIPNVAFWNSFSAPALKATSVKRQRPAEDETDAPGVHKRSKKECKAGNRKCGLETGRSVLLGDQSCLPCDICCTEPGFCRECKCILCCKTIAPDLGESNFVRCVRIPSGNGMCGHAAHLECALTSKMAGVVKKRGLDMEYLCRRCDNRTDLRELVTLLLEAVGSTDVREQAEKSLELALEVMRGTERGGSGARVLESLVQTALRKVQSGVDIQEAFKELKDQGAAAEAARQQNLGRCPSLMEDAQQPEASLDQWLTSSGSPSSHPSPGTPSSFTSPRLKSNPSVTSGQLNGTPTVDGSLRKHRAVEGHTDHFGQAQTSQEGVSRYKNSHLGNKALIRNAGQVRGSHRIRAISSNVNNNGLEAICDSFTRTPGNHAAEPGSRDGSSLRANHNSNSVSKNLKDQRNASSGPGKLREDIVSTEICCKSCGACKRHTCNAVEITSSLKSAKTQDGGKKVSSTPRDEEPGNYDPDKQVADSDTGFTGSGLPRSTNPANGSAHKTGTSLQLLDSQCEQDMQNALQNLRRAQEAEFERAKACLTAKKESILRKYEVLQVSRREFSEHPVSSSLEVFDDLFLKVGAQFAGAKEERDNFKTMLTIGEGFGSVSKDDLKKFYRWPPEK